MARTALAPRPTRLARLALLAGLALAAPFATPAAAQRLGPDGGWLAYADPADAGYDAALLEHARETWEASDSAAFLVLEGGAVVASWGDVERRYMCHSARKSFLSALFGPYVSAGVVDLDATLAELGIDDTTPLTDAEQQATVLHLLQARSGVYLTAAYEPASNPKPPRGSEEPGARWCYNNWDFNTLVTIFNQVTGDDFFEALDARLLRPMGVQDWRLSDGYYHLQPEMSSHPAYPLRMSGRDMARLGQLFLQQGRWHDAQLLEPSWVERCSTSWSHDTWMGGYGLMWWVFEDNPLEEFGTYAALGVGQQMIAVLPELDMVIVNRTDTYVGDAPSMTDISRIMLDVIAARTGERAADAQLVPLPPVAREQPELLADAGDLSRFEGRFTRPPASLGREPFGDYELQVRDDRLVMRDPRRGTFELALLSDGSVLVEDSLVQLLPWSDDTGAFEGLVGWEAFVQGGFEALAADDGVRARELFGVAHERFPAREATLGAGALAALLDDDLVPARLLGAVPDAPSALLVDGWLGRVEEALREGGVGARAAQVGMLRRRVLALHGEALAALREAEAAADAARAATLEATDAAAVANAAVAEGRAALEAPATSPKDPLRDAPTVPTDALDALDALVDGYLAAYVAGDVASLGARLAEDAVFEDPTMRLAGRDAIVTGLTQVFEGLTIEAFDVERRMRSGPRQVLLDGRVRFSLSAAAYGRTGDTLRFELPLAVVLGVSNGRVVNHLDLVDSAAYEQQLRAQLGAD